MLFGSIHTYGFRFLVRPNILMAFVGPRACVVWVERAVGGIPLLPDASGEDILRIGTEL